MLEPFILHRKRSPNLQEWQDYPLWQCEKHQHSLSDADQVATCPDHLILPGLIIGFVPKNADITWIEFSAHEDADVWRTGEGGFSTKELMVLPADKLTNKFVQQVKDDFGAIAFGSATDDILSRYPESDCRIVFKGPIGLLRIEWQRLYGGPRALLALFRA